MEFVTTPELNVSVRQYIILSVTLADYCSVSDLLKKERLVSIGYPMDHGWISAIFTEVVRLIEEGKIRLSDVGLLYPVKPK